MHRFLAASILAVLSAPAFAGPVTSTWPVNGPDDTAGVAAPALSGWYACGDSYEDNVEIRDINQSLVRTITRQDILTLLPWMNLDGGPDGPDALAFSDSGRLLFIGVHDDTTAPDGGPSDGILRYDTQTGDLTLFARLEIFNQGSTWPHNAMAHYKGLLYAGVSGAIQVYRASTNDQTGPLLSTYATPGGAMVHGLAVDRGGNFLYASWNDQIYRAPISGSSLNFTLVGSGISNIRAIAYSDHYGGAANPGLYVLEATTSPAFSRVWYINPSMARGLLTYSPATYLVQPATEWHDLCATADGKLLAGADEDAVLISDTSDTRLSFDAWKADEFAQTVAFGRGLIAPDAGELSGMVIDADTQQGLARFHPATPDGACWTILLLLMNDRLNGDAAAQGQVRTILERYSGRAIDGLAPERTADGIYRHWIDPRTAGLASGWDPEYATMSTMLITLAAARAAAHYPHDASIQASAHAIICGVHNWDAYFISSNDAMYLKALAGGGPDTTSGAIPFNEGMIFAQQAFMYGGAISQTVYPQWLDRSRWPTATTVVGRPVTGQSFGGFLPAFVSLYELLVVGDFRNDPGWQNQVLDLRLSNAAWTDDNGPKYNTVFSAGTTESQWGGYHADSLSSHPGDLTTLTSLMAFCAGTGAGGGSTPEAVAAYNAYRRGARETFQTGASLLYRRSNVDQAYTPNSAGLPDVALGALGLAELLQPGSVAAVLTGTYPTCSPCGSADFNGDGDLGTDADIEAFFACIGGNCCPTCDWHGADFNGDGDLGTDADIEAFFRVLAGGAC
jgi:hypothetical protein